MAASPTIAPVEQLNAARFDDAAILKKLATSSRHPRRRRADHDLGPSLGLADGRLMFCRSGSDPPHLKVAAQTI